MLPNRFPSDCGAPYTASASQHSWLNWPLIRAHLCTLAVAISLNSTWSVPRDVYRYGGMSYLLVLSIAMVTVALPATLLQLAIGQLSQQDAVGVWRAVPFFKGVGYLRLLISYIASIYSMVYLAVTALIYFLFAVNNDVPFWECPELNMTLGGDSHDNDFSEITCLNSTFLTPIGDQPEYYIALTMLTIVLWIIFPFIFYNPVKLMKRILYILGPLVWLLMIVIASCIGSRNNLSTLHSHNDWCHYLESKIWHSAVTQALLSSQVAGGFLISSGAAIYSNTNVQRTTWLIIGMNVVGSWFSVIFWFSVAGGEVQDVSPLAVLVQMYKAAEYRELDIIWPILVFAMLFLSGIISMLVFLYPLYDRFCRAGGQGWRIMSFTSSFFGAAAALSVLIVGLPAFSVLEETAVPILVSLTTVLEIIAFIFIYGWKPLGEDVAFLTERVLKKVWVYGWFVSPLIVSSLTVWWLVALFLENESWMESPWQAITIVATILVAVAVFFGLAAASVAKQVQYDLLGKIKSSFKPSRHWGPRDPITYYYWLARRQESQTDEVDNLPSRYTRRQLGQMTGETGIFNISQQKKDLEENR